MLLFLFDKVGQCTGPHWTNADHSTDAVYCAGPDCVFSAVHAVRWRRVFHRGGPFVLIERQARQDARAAATAHREIEEAELRVRMLIKRLPILLLHLPFPPHPLPTQDA